MILLANSNVLIARQSGSNAKNLNPNLMAVWRRFATLRSLAVLDDHVREDVPGETAPILKIWNIDPPAAPSGLSYEKRSSWPKQLLTNLPKPSPPLE
jgi:hypothetical protein